MGGRGGWGHEGKEFSLNWVGDGVQAATMGARLSLTLGHDTYWLNGSSIFLVTRRWLSWLTLGNFRAQYLVYWRNGLNIAFLKAMFHQLWVLLPKYFHLAFWFGSLCDVIFLKFPRDANSIWRKVIWEQLWAKFF